VFVEARKSTGTELDGPALDDGLELTDLDGGLIEVSELDPGREFCVPLEVGRIALSEVKKLEPLFRTAGDDGMFCRVSMVRSDNEGRGFRGTATPNFCSSSTGMPPFPGANSSSSEESRRTNSSRNEGFEGFLNNAS
jgi:hypothetical protein